MFCIFARNCAIVSEESFISFWNIFFFLFSSFSFSFVDVICFDGDETTKHYNFRLKSKIYKNERCLYCISSASIYQIYWRRKAKHCNWLNVFIHGIFDIFVSSFSFSSPFVVCLSNYCASVHVWIDTKQFSFFFHFDRSLFCIIMIVSLFILLCAIHQKQLNSTIDNR